MRCLLLIPDGYLWYNFYDGYLWYNFYMESMNTSRSRQRTRDVQLSLPSSIGIMVCDSNTSSYLG